MYCQAHRTYNCMSPTCVGFYQGMGHSFPGMDIGYDTATGGVGVFEDFGGGIGVDLNTGDAAIDVGGIIIDL